MNKIFLFAAGLIFSGIASGASTADCTQNLEGRQSCRSGVMTKCVKVFDPKTHTMNYEWFPVNSESQPLNVDSPMYKKIFGYTPISCSDAEKKAK